MKSTKRLPIVAAALFVGVVTAHAQSAPSSLGGSMLVQRKQTLAVAVAPIDTLWSKGALSISFDGLAGTQVGAQGAAIGAAFDFHWAWNSSVGLTLGLGCTYDVAESFKLSNLTSNSVGLLAGIQVRF